MNILSLLVFCVTSAVAYVPNSEFVLERVSKNAGKGAFIIENEVQFRSPAESITVKEKWWIQDSTTMRMSARGPGVSIDYTYKDGRSEFVNESGKTMSRRVPSEMLERFFFARQAKSLSDYLNAAKVISHNAARPRPKVLKVSEIKNEEDPHMRLDRIGPDVMIAITQNVDATQIATSPGIWVDQSTYLIRRIRFSNNAELSAQIPVPLSQNLVLPKERILTWPSGSAELRMIRANSVTKLNDSDLQPLSTNTTGTSALSVTIKEFYSRFR